MKITISPKTKPGKITSALMGTVFLMVAIFQALMATGQEPGETITDNLVLTIPGLLAFIAGITSMITGLISIIKSKERSIIVFLATALGIYIFIFIINEFLSH